MKKRTIHLVSLTLCVIMLAAAVSPALAEDGGWSLDSATGTLTVSGNLSVGLWDRAQVTRLVVGDEVDYLPEGGCRDCALLTEVELGTGVGSIPSIFFSDCTALTQIDIPENVISIASMAFKDSGLESITLHGGISAGKNAFGSCLSLSSVQLESGATVGESAFSGCTALKSVQLGDGCTVGKSAFSGCAALERVVIGDDVIVPASAFTGCSDGLVLIGAADGVAYELCSRDDALRGRFVSRSTLPSDYELTLLPSMANLTAGRTYPSGKFSDVDFSAWYGEGGQNVIAKTYELGVIDGKSDSVFDPEGEILVCEAIKMAAAVHSGYMFTSYSFPSGEPWYQPYVDYCIENGVCSYEDFGGAYTEKISRRQMAALFRHALPTGEFAELNAIAFGSIPDVASGDKYADEIYSLYRSGVLTGDSGTGSFRPDDSVSRAEAAAIICRVCTPSERKAFELEAPASTAPPAQSGGDGKTRVSCTWCGGDGKVTCSGCGGDGTVTRWSAAFDRYEEKNCSSCFFGQVDCNHCMGKGYTYE